MKAILMSQHGAPDVLMLSDVPTPEPKGNEVLVKLAFAGLNYVDIWVRKGNGAYPIQLPHIPGADGAGIVEAVGPEAEGVSPGDRVLIFPGISDGTCDRCLHGQENQCDQFEILGAKRRGTYAEYVAVPDQNIVPIPDEVSFETAAAFPLVYLTAWHMLIGRAKLVANETVLVLGASGGVGSAAIQIAKLKGAKVFAATSSRDKMKKIKSFGAEDVFLEEKDADLHKWILKNTNNRGVDVVVEHVGPVTWEKSLKSLAKCGRLVTCGATTGPTVQLDLRYVFSRDLSVLGARMGTPREFQDLSAAVFKGDLTPVIGKIFPLIEAGSAQDFMEAKQQMGKILLKIN